MDLDERKKQIQYKLLEYLAHLIQKHIISSNSSQFNFKLLMVQIYLRRLSNPTRAWFILSNFYETYNKFSAQSKFYIFCMFQELYERLILNDRRSNHSHSKIVSIINFDKINSEFHSRITKSTNLVKDFWVMFMNDKQKKLLNSSAFNSSLTRISNEFKALQSIFNTIQKQYEDNPLIFYIYCCYLKHIINNDHMAEHIIKLLREIKENKTHKDSSMIDDEYYKMTSIEEIGLMKVSCNNLEIGKIKWCNEKASHITKFSENELLKLKINKLIPPIIALKHNDYIKSFISTSKARFINQTRLSVIISSSNYMIPVIIYYKIIPQIKNGIEICTMLHSIMDSTFILYKNPEIKIDSRLCLVLISEDGSIEAVDRNSNIYLGIPNFVRDGWKLKISIDKKKCNLLDLSPSLKEGISGNKFNHECTLDTSILEEDYYNDENGLFLSINFKLKQMMKIMSGKQNFESSMNDRKFNEVHHKSCIDLFTPTTNYYDIESIDEDEDSETFAENNSSRMKYLQRRIICTIFNKHSLKCDIYQMDSSNGDLKLYLIKFYFDIAKLRSNLEEADRKFAAQYNESGTGGDIPFVNMKSGIIYFIIRQPANLYS